MSSDLDTTNTDWSPVGDWSRWDAWRVGVIEHYGDTGITWPADNPDPLHPMSVAYDEGRAWGRRYATNHHEGGSMTTPQTSTEAIAAKPPILTYLTDTYTLERVVVSTRNDQYGTRVDYTLERQVGSPFVLITCDDDAMFTEDTQVHGDLADFERVAEAWVRNFHEREYGA